jgi:HPt (histidine-containing phosphotransfer) domain-containing protein
VDEPQTALPTPEVLEQTTSSVSVSSNEIELPSMPGLDTQDGLTRVGGNRKLYRKLLRQFVEKQGPVAVQIDDALNNGDRELAERLAHTLKGVAGNIGAKQIQFAAADLEKSIREKMSEADVESTRQQVAVVLDPLVARLGAALNSLPSETTQGLLPQQQVSPEQSREAATQLSRLLADFDAGAAEFIEANRAAVRSIFADDAWEKFEQQVEDYSFADALVRLEDAMKRLPTT